MEDTFVGDKINFTDINGKKYKYKVYEIDILDEDELDKLTSSDYDLTLFTCTTGGTKRHVVKCNEIYEYSE